MKKKILVYFLLKLALVSAAPAMAGIFTRSEWKASTDFSAAPKAGFAREVHDGNWLYTASWAPFSVSHPSGLEFHAGLLQGWRANKGDPATCTLFGVKTGKLSDFIAGANRALNLPTFFKPLEYAGSAVEFDTFAGGRVQHGPDVHTFVYGFNIELSIAFGETELQKGL